MMGVENLRTTEPNVSRETAQKYMLGHTYDDSEISSENFKYDLLFSILRIWKNECCVPRGLPLYVYIFSKHVIYDFAYLIH